MQGIPAVKAVWQGQLVAEFTGAIPEEQARQFVDELVKATTGGAVPGADDEEAGAPEDPRLDAAEAALERGDLAAAEAAYQAILDAEPDHPEASLALRQVQLFRRADEAGPDALAAAEAAPDDVAAQTRAADFLLGTGNVQEAFDLLLAVVRRTAGEDRDQVRKHLVELFAVVGDEDPRVARPAGSSPSRCSDGGPGVGLDADVAVPDTVDEAAPEQVDQLEAGQVGLAEHGGVVAVREQELDALVEVAGGDLHGADQPLVDAGGVPAGEADGRTQGVLVVDRPAELVAHGERVGDRDGGHDGEVAQFVGRASEVGLVVADHVAVGAVDEIPVRGGAVGRGAAEGLDGRAVERRPEDLVELAVPELRQRRPDQVGQLPVGRVALVPEVVVLGELDLRERTVGTEAVAAGLRPAVVALLEGRDTVEVGAVSRLRTCAGADGIAQQEVAPQQFVELRRTDAGARSSPSATHRVQLPARQSAWVSTAIDARGPPTRAWTACPNSSAITNSGTNCP